MTPLPPSTPSGVPSSRTPSGHGRGGRVQRDVRLQAALALVVGVAIVAVPLFLWSSGKKRSGEHAATSASSVEEAGPPTVFFGDAGAAVSIDAGGRSVTFGEPRYLKCQDPGPTKTAPEKCDHLGAIEDLVTKAIAEQVATCLPAVPTTQTVAFVVDVSFKRKKMRMKDGKDGSTMPAAQRKKLASCIEKGLLQGTPPNWDAIGHAHQRYLFQFLATFGATAAPTIPAAPANAPVPPGPTAPP